METPTEGYQQSALGVHTAKQPSVAVSTAKCKITNCQLVLRAQEGGLGPPAPWKDIRRFGGQKYWYCQRDFEQREESAQQNPFIKQRRFFQGYIHCKGKLRRSALPVLADRLTAGLTHKPSNDCPSPSLCGLWRDAWPSDEGFWMESTLPYANQSHTLEEEEANNSGRSGMEGRQGQGVLRQALGESWGIYRPLDQSPCFCQGNEPSLTTRKHSQNKTFGALRCGNFYGTWEYSHESWPHSSSSRVSNSERACSAHGQVSDP